MPYRSASARTSAGPMVACAVALVSGAYLAARVGRWMHPSPAPRPSPAASPSAGAEPPVYFSPIAPVPAVSALPESVPPSAAISRFPAEYSAPPVPPVMPPVPAGPPTAPAAPAREAVLVQVQPVSVVPGQPIQISVTVSDTGGRYEWPTGSLSISEGARTLLGPVTVDIHRGATSLLLGELPGGPHRLTVSFEPDTTRWQRGSAQMQINSPTHEPVLVRVGQVRVREGEPIQIPVTVSDAGGQYEWPTGSLNISEGAKLLVGPITVDVHRGATYVQIAELSGGKHTLTVSFEPDTARWQRGSAEIQVSIPTNEPVLVRVQPVQAREGQSFQFPVTVSDAGGGSALPSGTLTIAEGTQTLAGPIEVNARHGSTYVRLGDLPAGKHTLTVSFEPETTRWQRGSATVRVDVESASGRGGYRRR